MSAQFFQSSIPQENQSIKCNDITVRGSVVANESVAVAKGISLNGALSFEANTDPAVSGTITLPALPAAYSQITSETTNVTITGAEQQFKIDTFATGSIAAGANVSFSVFHSGYEVGKTLVLIANGLSDNTLITTNCFVAYATNGAFIITRHNVGAVAQADKQTIIVKLVQSA